MILMALAGGWIGFLVGFAVAAMLAAAKRGDEMAGRYWWEDDGELLREVATILAAQAIAEQAEEFLGKEAQS